MCKLIVQYLHLLRITSGSSVAVTINKRWQLELQVRTLWTTRPFWAI